MKLRVKNSKTQVTHQYWVRAKKNLISVFYSHWTSVPLWHQSAKNIIAKGPIYTERQHQCCDVASDITLNKLLTFIYKPSELLQKWAATPIDQIWWKCWRFRSKSITDACVNGTLRQTFSVNKAEQKLKSKRIPSISFRFHPACRNLKYINITKQTGRVRLELIHIRRN